MHINIEHPVYQLQLKTTSVIHLRRCIIRIRATIILQRLFLFEILYFENDSHAKFCIFLVSSSLSFPCTTISRCIKQLHSSTAPCQWHRVEERERHVKMYSYSLSQLLTKSASEGCRKSEEQLSLSSVRSQSISFFSDCGRDENIFHCSFSRRLLLLIPLYIPAPPPPPRRPPLSPKYLPVEPAASEAAQT